jgi:ubiquinone/menaquinone biosynthesis C-methylase UbiE
MSDEAVRVAFDAAAPTYDEDFTASIIGGLQRDAVWRSFKTLFPPGSRLLDLGCGAGEDAIRFARRGIEVDGIDVSPAMVEIARDRARSEGADELTHFTALPVERLAELPECGYTGAISSFGPLNCVADLRPVAAALAERLRPGSPVALCLMSRFCLWETLLYPLTLQLHKAARRFSQAWTQASVSNHDGFRVYYPTVADVRRAFAPEFRLERAPGIGVLMPPTYLEPFAQRFPRLMRLLARIDRAIAHWPGFRSIADHRLIILRRR